MKKLSVLIGSAALLAVMSFAIAAHRTGPAVGAAAPSFEATDVSGKSVKLADYKGKYVVLEWSNFDCPYVHKHYDNHNMQNLQKAYTEKGVAWLTVFTSSPYSASELKTMGKEKGMSSTLVADPKGTLGQLYGATNTPDMIVINPEGKVIYEGAIDNNRSADPAAIKTSTNYVAAALDASMAGKPVTVSKSRPYGCGIHYGN